MKRIIKNYLLRFASKLTREQEKMLQLVGRRQAQELHYKRCQSLTEAEFSVYSQYGEDGIIQYLISRIDIPNKIFIEFGVENYREANTRFLLVNNNWSGLVIDSCRSNIHYIRKDPIYWKHQL